MKSISQAVEETLGESDTAYFALQGGILNLSAYAKQIRKQIQNICKKPIKSTGAIIMALSRLQKKNPHKRVGPPKLLINGITVKENLTELVFPKSPDTVRIAKHLITSSTLQPVLITYGMNEVSLIIQARNTAQIKKQFSPFRAIAVLPNLVSMTLGTVGEHAFVPNIFYSLLGRLATKEINIIDISTTHSEITLILELHVLPKAYKAIYAIFQEREKLF